ncbi:hypothetical protein G155_02190 [Mycobacterium sp. VKM Ac-1817D]|nr:hypothetical protein G155_02190 [Mycobacterium sp. VKM Ac-1817D]
MRCRLPVGAEARLGQAAASLFAGMVATVVDEFGEAAHDEWGLLHE